MKRNKQFIFIVIIIYICSLKVILATSILKMFLALFWVDLVEATKYHKVRFQILCSIYIVEPILLKSKLQVERLSHLMMNT